MQFKIITLASTLAIGLMTSARSQTIYVESAYRQTDLSASIGNMDDTRPSDTLNGVGNFTNTNVGPASVSGISYWGGPASADATVTQNSTITVSPSQTNLLVTGSMHDLVHYAAAAIDPDTGHYGGASVYARSYFFMRIVTDAPFLFTLNVTNSHAGSTDGSSIYDGGQVASYVSFALGGGSVVFAEYGEQGQLGSPSFHVAATNSGTFSEILPAGSYELNAIVEDNRDGNGSGGPSISDVGNRTANFTLTASPAPTSPQPPFILSYTHADGTNNTITAHGTPLDPFVLQIKSALEITNGWVDVQTNSADAGGAMTFVYTTPVTNSAMFFRIRTM